MAGVLIKEAIRNVDSDKPQSTPQARKKPRGRRAAARLSSEKLQK
jgi:hypothetical protein